MTKEARQNKRSVSPPGRARSRLASSNNSSTCFPWRGALLGLTLVVGGLLAGCAKSTTPQASRETNWLTLCESSADCQGSDCLCGVCSRECSADSQCGSQVLCQGSDSMLVNLACGSGETVTGLCAPQCEGDGDCVGEQLCVQGACAPLLDLDAGLLNMDATP